MEMGIKEMGGRDPTDGRRTVTRTRAIGVLRSKGVMGMARLISNSRGGHRRDKIIRMGMKILASLRNTPMTRPSGTTIGSRRVVASVSIATCRSRI
jgi:hypothetical protein